MNTTKRTAATPLLIMTIIGVQFLGWGVAVNVARQQAVLSMGVLAVITAIGISLIATKPSRATIVGAVAMTTAIGGLSVLAQVLPAALSS